MGKHDHTKGKKKCIYCGRYFFPAGLGAHIKMRERIGHCPTGEPYPKRKARLTGRIDNWTLEDCEDFT